MKIGSKIKMDSSEWVEIVDIKSRKYFYTNLITGQSQMEKPMDSYFKKANKNQWWELYDLKTKRFYYYNAFSQITVWRKPENAEIVPLAKIQTSRNTFRKVITKDEETQTFLSLENSIVEESMVVSDNDNLDESKLTSGYISLDEKHNVDGLANPCIMSRSFNSDRSQDFEDDSMVLRSKQIQNFPRTNPAFVTLQRPNGIRELRRITPPDLSHSFSKSHQTQFKYLADNQKFETDHSSKFKRHSIDTADSKLIINKNNHMSSHNHADQDLDEQENNCVFMGASSCNVSTESIDMDATTQEKLKPLHMPKSGRCYSENDSTDLLRRTSYIKDPRNDPLSLAEFDIESFATKFLNDQRSGFLGKQLTLRSMLTWTKECIKKPLLRTSVGKLKKESCDIFRLIQQYMGDRKLKNMSSLDDVGLEVVTHGWLSPVLRDEIYMQLSKQTNQNPLLESETRGWELMCICLSFFPPSNLYPYISSRILRPFDAQLLSNKQMVDCIKHLPRRLQKVISEGAKKGLCKPIMKEFEHSKSSIYVPSMFGCLLEEVISMQLEKFPNRKLPWILTTLCETVLDLNGTTTEGIFRVPGDIDLVNLMKVQCDSWSSPIGLTTDPAIPCSLLKLWLRELLEPLVPFDLYELAIQSSSAEDVKNVVNQLPELNKNVLLYLVRFLQIFADAKVAKVTRMDVNNLAMVMAPNFLRSCSTSETNTILENMKKEMTFVRSLIVNLSTDNVQGLK